ncbi:MAG: hypothetical protein IIA05_01595 [Proteobacteria bacterium]|nr:hypothetical protein [Pseudomonadota bacterium]
MCAIDWGFVAAWVGALATAGLLIAAIYGLGVWKSQFIKTRDHDLALRILHAISNSHIVFDELRTPYALFSDSDVQVEPPEGDGPDPLYEYRKMFARYKARSMHVFAVRKERTALILEALELWEDGDYVVRLGELINLLAPMEDSVLAEAENYVDSLRPDLEDVAVEFDRNILYSPLDAETPDPTNDAYQTAKTNILNHLRPKIRME